MQQVDPSYQVIRNSYIVRYLLWCNERHQSKNLFIGKGYNNTLVDTVC